MFLCAIGILQGIRSTANGASDSCRTSSAWFQFEPLSDVRRGRNAVFQSSKQASRAASLAFIPRRASKRRTISSTSPSPVSSNVTDPATTITISPRAGSDVNRAHNALNDPPITSSCIFVSSRITVASRSPSAANKSSRVSARRFRRLETNYWHARSRRLADGNLTLGSASGENPSMMNGPINQPRRAAAVASADAPGIGETVMPASRAARTMSRAGSAMPGVPASVTRATSLFLTASSSSSRFDRSLKR